MRHLVVGTAGHVDHGKSALVEALTGIDPDRLAEEKRRGITIDLGFADLDVGAERTVSFVDVPGHERFVRHMVAGATGVDAVLLVVAADEGVRPQTREHLDICKLLGVSSGAIALTKCDLVDDEIRRVVELEVVELVEGSFLEAARPIAVSARSGTGLDALREALAALFDTVPARPGAGVARLPVDRSFVLKGFGTVVTGTLASGRLAEGQEIAVLPGRARGRIRGLQVHGSAVAEASAGQRTAVNVQGLDRDAVPRGATITTPGALAAGRRAWARVRLLPDAPAALGKGGEVRFHHGTTEGAARMRVFGAGADGALHVELRLARPTVLAPGDRFILRRPAPVDTVGGGVVVDADPPPARAIEKDAFEAAALEPGAALRRRLARAGAGGRTAAELAPVLALPAAAIEAELRRAGGAAVAAGARWFDGELWSAVSRRVLEAVRAYHADHPLEEGASRETLRGTLAADMPQDAWRELLERLAARGELRLRGETVADSGHSVVLSGADAELADRIERRYREAGLEPPELSELLAPHEVAPARPIVERLVARGKLARIQGGRLFHCEALERLRAALREYARSSPTIDVAAFKKLAGVTRKNAIPLLEQLDAERTTRRVGDRREILPPRAE